LKIKNHFNKYIYMNKLLIIAAVVILLIMISNMTFASQSKTIGAGTPGGSPGGKDVKQYTDSQKQWLPILAIWLAANSHGVDKAGFHEWTDSNVVWRGSDSESAFSNATKQLIGSGFNLPPINTNVMASGGGSFWDDVKTFAGDIASGVVKYATKG
jgi:hypothetical protein